jgi:hypothetical protein
MISPPAPEAITLGSSVARFFLVQNIKTGENIPNYHKIYKMAIKYF